MASPKMQGYMAPYSGILFTLETTRAGTLSGSQNLDTGTDRDSVAPLLNYCANDIGWSVAQYRKVATVRGVCDGVA